MFKKFLNALFHTKEDACIDAKIWIQKVLLDEKYRKINS